MKNKALLAALVSTVFAMRPSDAAAMIGALRADFYAGNEAAKFTPAQDRKIAAAAGAVLLMPIMGYIAPREDIWVRTFGGTGLDVFAKRFTDAVNNPDIKAIILEVDSPGGSVTGVAEMSAMIYAARGTKPIIAQVNALAASAAYHIASAADEIVVTPSGEVGSVGVYTLHEDISKYLEEMGVKETFIFAGKFKVEGNPYEPLTDEARAAMQEGVDRFYESFISDLAKNRGLKKSDVEKNFGQGRCFGPADAISRGMADRQDTLQGTLERFGVKLYSNNAARKAAPVERMKREAEFLGLGSQVGAEST